MDIGCVPAPVDLSQAYAAPKIVYVWYRTILQLSVLQLSAFSFQLSVFSFQFSVFSKNPRHFLTTDNCLCCGTVFFFDMMFAQRGTPIPGRIRCGGSCGGCLHSADRRAYFGTRTSAFILRRRTKYRLPKTGIVTAQFENGSEPLYAAGEEQVLRCVHGFVGMPARRRRYRLLRMTTGRVRFVGTLH